MGDVLSVEQLELLRIPLTRALERAYTNRDIRYVYIQACTFIACQNRSKWVHTVISLSFSCV